MKTITINIYQFSELSEEAKERAINDHREFLAECGLQYFTGEAFDSLKAGIDSFGANLRDYSIDWENRNGTNLRIDFPEYAEEITGLRLRTWIVNNMGSTLTEGKPYGEYRGKKNGGYKRRSRVIKIDTCCPFTGVCYDESFLQPVRDYLTAKKPDSTYSLEELINDCCDSLLKDVESEIEYRYTDEAIIEEIEANEYDFTENGKIA